VESQVDRPFALAAALSVGHELAEVHVRVAGVGVGPLSALRPHADRGPRTALDLTVGCHPYGVTVGRTVKQTAQRAGLPARTVRYYDAIGLVSPQRGEQGYRFYSPEEEGKLHFVVQAKALGFSLEDIRELMAAAERGCCGEVIPELQRLLDDKVAEVDARIAELRSFRQRLLTYRAGKHGGCGCAGHGAFCGCLNDAPLIQIQPRR